MPNFLIPLLTLKDNGGVTVAMAFARALHAEGMKVTVLASAFHGIQTIRRPENKGIQFVISPAGFGNPVIALSILFVYAAIYSLLRRPRIIYTHILTCLIPNFSGKRPFILAQDLEYRFFSGYRRRLAKILFQWMTNRCHLIVSSLWLKKFFIRRRADILFAGDVGIYKALFGQQTQRREISLRPIDFLLIAKSGRHKRYDETCAAAVLLAQHGYQVTLIDQVGAIKNCSAVAGLRIFNAVNQVDLCQLYGESKVFVGLSRAEGYGLPPLEALSQGCSVVVTPAPSVKFIINENLIVIKKRDNLVKSAVDFAVAFLPKMKNLTNNFYAGPYIEDWCCHVIKAIRSELP